MVTGFPASASIHRVVRRTSQGKPAGEVTRDFISALESQGLKIVPVEPTEDMQKAGYELMGGGSAFVYRAMLNAVEG